MRRSLRPLLIAAAAALLLAGGATAAVFAVHTITLKPGKCHTVSKTLKICAAAAASRGGGGGGGGVSTKTVTTVKTVATTVTVGPSPIGKTFSGQGGTTTIATFTLKTEDTLNWTEQILDSDSDSDCIEIDDQNSNDLADNSPDCSAGAGSTTLQAGTYTLTVTADSPWTITL